MYGNELQEKDFLMDSWFEDLSETHTEWLRITRKAEFEEGIKRTLVEKYPDPVHFIFELLQNADDQQATKASFKLRGDKLIFSHNGNPFTRNDVKNITGIGNTEKNNLENKI